MSWIPAKFQIATLLLIAALTTSLAKEERVAIKDVPAAVTAAVKKRFPEAQVTGAEKEDDDGVVVFELQLKDKGQTIDVAISPDGTIREIEKQVKFETLPKKVQEVVAAKYPNAKVKLVEEVIHVKDGKEVFEYYELKVATAEKEVTEVQITAAGEIKQVEKQSDSDES